MQLLYNEKKPMQFQPVFVFEEWPHMCDMSDFSWFRSILLSSPYMHAHEFYLLVKFKENFDTFQFNHWEPCACQGYWCYRVPKLVKNKFFCGFEQLILADKMSSETKFKNFRNNLQLATREVWNNIFKEFFKTKSSFENGILVYH